MGLSCCPASARNIVLYAPGAVRRMVFLVGFGVPSALIFLTGRVHGPLTLLICSRVTSSQLGFCLSLIRQTRVSKAPVHLLALPTNRAVRGSKSPKDLQRACSSSSSTSVPPTGLPSLSWVFQRPERHKLGRDLQLPVLAAARHNLRPEPYVVRISIGLRFRTVELNFPTVSMQVLKPRRSSVKPT